MNELTDDRTDGQTYEQLGDPNIRIASHQNQFELRTDVLNSFLRLLSNNSAYEMFRFFPP